MPGHALAIAKVHAIVARASDRFLNADYAKNGQARIGEGLVKRPIAIEVGRVDVDRFVLVQAESVDVFGFKDGIVREGPLVPDIEFFGNRVAVIGMHQTAGRTPIQLGRRRGNRRHRVDTEAPVAEENSCPRNFVTRSDREETLVDGWVGLLDHEERNVLVNISVVETVAAANNVLAVTFEVVGKAKARAEVLVVVLRQGRSVGATDGQKFL